MSTPIQIAESYIGFRSRALRTNDFGAKTNNNTKIWSGSFLQVVFNEAWAADWAPVSFTHTVHALEYVRMRNLTVSKPRVGDVVFLAYGTDGDMSQPHVGMVADVQNWKDRGILQVIEGETAPNTAKGHSGIADGVWKRTRYAAEVLEFARMENWTAGYYREGKRPLLDPKDFKYLGRGKNVEIVQRALGDIFGNRLRGLKKGMWDAQTSHAYAQWQRITGHTATGLPDIDSFAKLSLESGRFGL